MNPTVNTITIVVIVLAITNCFYYFTKRYKYQKILVELLLGVIIASTFLGGILKASYISQLALVGSVVLLFSVGFGSNLRHLESKGKEILTLASGGVIFPFLLVLFGSRLLGVGTLPSLFIAAACVSTSVGITARILLDRDKCDTDLGNIILGSSVLDDIYGLLLLAFLLPLAIDGIINLRGILGTVLGIITLFAIIAASFFAKTKIVKMSKESNKNLWLLTPLSVSFPFIAKGLGLTPITGAYFSGLLLSGLRVKEKFMKYIRLIYKAFVPIFFVYIGSQVNMEEFLRAKPLLIGLLITALILIGQLLAGLLLTKKLGLKKSLTVGFGMLPRGEVALIIASAGLAVGAISKDYFASILLMIFISALVVPMFFGKMVHSCDL